MQLRVLFCLILIVVFSCTKKSVEIKNFLKDQLINTKHLKLVQTKKILLDKETAPKSHYTQVYKDSVSGTTYFTLLNNYNNTIYFYNYNTLSFVKKLEYNKNNPDKVLKLRGYHIKTMDSIYIYNEAFLELILINSDGEFLAEKSLIGGENIRKSPWIYKYPQYYPRTVAPFLETKEKLLLPGQYMFSVPETIIDSFKFTAYADFNMKQITYEHNYPKELYGYNYNWDDQVFTDVFSELHPDGDKLIFSFPVSHHVYIADFYSKGYRKVYAGSNEAGSISSIPIETKQNRNSKLVLRKYALMQDLYGAIKYDKYRGVYYRFITRAISYETDHTTSWNEKHVGVIIMDEDFNYLGETTLGIGNCKCP